MPNSTVQMQVSQHHTIIGVSVSWHFMQHCSKLCALACTGAGPVSSLARLPLKLAMPDITAVSLPAQLSPLGKKPPLCGPIQLQASAADTAACTGLAGEHADSRCAAV